MKEREEQLSHRNGFEITRQVKGEDDREKKSFVLNMFAPGAGNYGDESLQSGSSQSRKVASAQGMASQNHSKSEESKRSDEEDTPPQQATAKPKKNAAKG